MQSSEKKPRGRPKTKPEIKPEKIKREKMTEEEVKQKKSENWRKWKAEKGGDVWYKEYYEQNKELINKRSRDRSKILTECYKQMQTVKSVLEINPITNI